MKELQRYKVKIRGDAGIYKVYKIDWYNNQMYINRTITNEWVNFDKIKEIIPVTYEEFIELK
jgi:hypothetical protein